MCVCLCVIVGFHGNPRRDLAAGDMNVQSTDRIPKPPKLAVSAFLHSLGVYVLCPMILYNDVSCRLCRDDDGFVTANPVLINSLIIVFYSLVKKNVINFILAR